MTRSYTPPHYSALGIQMMGQMFEQQMRIAQTLGAVAIATNPMLARQERVFARDLPKARQVTQPVKQLDVTPIRRSHAPSQPPRMPQTFMRTHATPV